MRGVSVDGVSMRRGRGGGVAALGAVAALLTGAAPASADISPVVFRVQATNSLGTGFTQGLLTGGSWGPGGSYSWSLLVPREIRNGAGDLIARLTQASVFILEDPLVTIGFAVQAGADDTLFEINSALLSFPAISPAEGRADGGITGTDTNGNGVTLTGLQPGGNMLIAQYNGFVPGGTTFADMIQGPLSTATPFGTVVGGGMMPLAGYMPIPDPVSDISLQYRFTLSAHDIASGTAAFEVIPAPGATGLMLLAGAVALRRRRG